MQPLFKAFIILGKKNKLCKGKKPSYYYLVFCHDASKEDRP